MIPISEYLESFLVSYGFEDGHAVGSDLSKAGILQLLYYFPVYVCYKMHLYWLKIKGQRSS